MFIMHKLISLISIQLKRDKRIDYKSNSYIEQRRGITVIHIRRSDITDGLVVGEVMTEIVTGPALKAHNYTRAVQ